MLHVEFLVIFTKDFNRAKILRRQKRTRISGTSFCEGGGMNEHLDLHKSIYRIVLNLDFC